MSVLKCKLVILLIFCFTETHKGEEYFGVCLQASAYNFISIFVVSFVKGFCCIIFKVFRNFHIDGFVQTFLLLHASCHVHTSLTRL